MMHLTQPARRTAPFSLILRAFFRPAVIVPALLLAAMLTAGAAEKRNVLFLISDDLTGTVLGCYGNQQCRTPNIDRLAARSVRFERAYCQFPVCGPARAALFSGLYPQQNGVTGNGASGRLERRLGNRPTLPEQFRRHGWHAARVSKIYHMRVPGDITAGVDGPDHAAIRKKLDASLGKRLKGMSAMSTAKEGALP